MNRVGLIKYQLSDFGGASASYQKVLDITRKLNNRSATAIALNDLAVTAIETKQYDAAEGYNREALELKRATGNKASELYSLLNQGRIAAGRAQYPEAANSFNRVIHDSGDDASLHWEAETNSPVSMPPRRQNRPRGIPGIPQSPLHNRYCSRQSLQRRAPPVFPNHGHPLLQRLHRFPRLSRPRPRGPRGRRAQPCARMAKGLKVPVSQLGGAAFNPEQNARKMNSLVLSYWLKPERSYLWVVTPSKVVHFPAAWAGRVDAASQDYRRPSSVRALKPLPLRARSSTKCGSPPPRSCWRKPLRALHLPQLADVGGGPPRHRHCRRQPVVVEF